jgi:hypothetical protein
VEARGGPSDCDDHTNHRDPGVEWKQRPTEIAPTTRGNLTVEATNVHVDEEP